MRHPPSVLVVRSEASEDDLEIVSAMRRQMANLWCDVVGGHEEAQAVLEDRPIDVVLVVDLAIRPKLGLISYMLQRHLEAEVIVSSREADNARKPAAVDEPDSSEFAHIPWPLSAEGVDTILARAKSPCRKGVTLPGFLQLLRDEGVTCTIDVHSNKQDIWASGDDGLVVFDEGRLVYAEVDGYQGKEALLQVMEWTTPEIKLNYNHRIDNIATEKVDLLDGLSGATFAGGGSIETQSEQEIVGMADIQNSLQAALGINGALGAALVDFNSGMCVGEADSGSGLDLGLAAAGNTEVVRAKREIVSRLGLNQEIEDILITLQSQYHLIRVLKNNSNLFFYLVLDRKKSNLAMARLELEKLDAELELK